ncbi:hypothetical protein LOK49_LG03G03107 [Camellia lanceoleosa]|uniref:Uncharacterized protein n=1 Tax=Camellia lanceoleosa TaxID=1840588 RepID=A0ACC0IFN9_9ERIC|nr:hypothetical protein LOK49_Contig211G00005 [Camellia lanceoleosa]KAI8023754.1 hypothetical protein LOK49_LG03G03107 [Camellia lanceoleosa]
MVSHVVSRRDMATQMSPRDNTGSSPKGRSSFSTSSPSILPIVESYSNDSAKLEIRDVHSHCDKAGQKTWSVLPSASRAGMCVCVSTSTSLTPLDFSASSIPSHSGLTPITPTTSSLESSTAEYGRIWPLFEVSLSRSSLKSRFSTTVEIASDLCARRV